MMKNNKIYFLFFAFFFSLMIVTVGYMFFLENTKENLLYNQYKANAASLQNNLKIMINDKQKTTLALALTLVNHDEKLPQYIMNNKLPKDYYKFLVSEYKNHTLYKNIWIQVLNKEGVSLYRSWSEKKGDTLNYIREDIASVMKYKQHEISMSVGKFDMSIKAIVPIFVKKEFVGIIEVISHFNSIAKELQKVNVDSIVLANTIHTKRLEYPFTKTFIGDYYVANLNTKKELRQYLIEHGVTNYFNNSFKIENGYLIVSSLLGKDSNPIGVYIMFQKLDAISSENIDDFILKWLLYGILILMGGLGAINVWMYYVLRKQKKYYQNIIDSSENIVVINNGIEIIEVNKIFFKYFDKYKDLNAFKKEHDCICDFFIEENEYIGETIDGVYWTQYILQNQNKSHKVKIIFSEKVYYFLVSASMISVEKRHYSMTFSDITHEENYKKKLEQISITDTLTGIYNRRYYHTKIDEEMYNSTRYNHPLSIIMYDIDFFKKVNDTHGHSTGDAVLIEYSNLIKSLLRGSDTLCRIGGEEFMIILPYTGINEAKKVAEKLRVSVEDYKKIVPITMSFGVTEYIKGESEDFIFKRVDDALYQAKESGRNRVVVG